MTQRYRPREYAIVEPRRHLLAINRAANMSHRNYFGKCPSDDLPIHIPILMIMGTANLQCASKRVRLALGSKNEDRFVTQVLPPSLGTTNDCDVQETCGIVMLLLPHLCHLTLAISGGAQSARRLLWLQAA